MTDLVLCAGYVQSIVGDHVWRFPKSRGTVLGGSHNKDDSILGYPFQGKYHMER